MREKLKVLIVEDVFLIQRMLQKLILEYADCQSAENGKKAVELYTSEYFNGEPFDVIFLDIFMPEMDGIEVLQSIRLFEDELKMKPEEKINIIMVTSMSNNNMIQKAKNLGCNGYITKPFSREQIISELKRLGLVKKAEGRFKTS
ncbi:MAG: response regulator [Calditrichaeota bacterium]|nr:MAG: response regulator [Calditrichota bacterium]MBL1203997.1 response regulator [Calditrichota bacterium]NOG43828.1 response regulator [Calditrichota bacterium]